MDPSFHFEQKTYLIRTGGAKWGKTTGIRKEPKCGSLPEAGSGLPAKVLNQQRIKFIYQNL